MQAHSRSLGIRVRDLVHAEGVGHVSNLARGVGCFADDVRRGRRGGGGGCGVARFAQGAGEDAHEAVGVGVVVDHGAFGGGPDEDELRDVS